MTEGIAPTTTTNPTRRRRRPKDVPADDGGGENGDVPWYTPTPEDLRLREVYGDWVHGNPGTHLDGGISEDGRWQKWGRDLAVMPPRRYDAPSGKVGRRFVNVLVREMRGMLDRRWNAECFIVFQTVTLQRARLSQHPGTYNIE